MRFRGEEYFRAAGERILEAREIHARGESYALAMYCSGLAVECLLRAFRWQFDSSFDGRHDLEELLRASQMLNRPVEGGFGYRDDGNTEQADREFRMAILEVVSLWHNNLRFCSEKSLKAYLRRLGRLSGMRGDPLRQNSRELLSAAQTVLNRGIALWASKKKSE